ncbi:MAG TPA: PepSY domain-containing protein [Hyphomicrobium sp.]|nr:PepSY domain-containing protein [Hyphomicrobium sp.]
MKTRKTKPYRALAMSLAALAAMGGGAHAGDDDDARDQELARKALQDGRIKSLAEITEKVKPTLPGTILGVELEVEDGGRIVYEFKVVDTGGLLKEVDVDAATAEILSIEDDD